MKGGSMKSLALAFAAYLVVTLGTGARYEFLENEGVWSWVLSVATVAVFIGLVAWRDSVRERPWEKDD